MNNLVLGAALAAALAAADAEACFLLFREPDMARFCASAEQRDICEKRKHFLHEIAGNSISRLQLARINQKRKACQAPSWERVFGGRDWDQAHAVVSLPDGGIVVAGDTGSKGAGKGDMWVLRLDARGNVVWEKTFGGGERDNALAAAALPDGSVVVSGYTESKGAGGSDAWVLRLDARGNKAWERTFGGSKPENAMAIAALPDGGMVVGGYTKSRGAGRDDMWVLRLNARGKIKWEKTYGGSGYESAHAVAAFPDGSVVVAGHTSSKGAGEDDMWVLRLDARGNVIWEKTFGGSRNDGAKAVAALPDGGVVVSGYTFSTSAGDSDMWVLRLDARGNVVWEKIFGGRKDDEAQAITALPDGGTMVAGHTYSKGGGSMDMWVLHLDARGGVVWERTFGGSGWDGASAVAALPDGGVVVAGYTKPENAGGFDVDMWILRLDVSGCVAK